MSKIINTLKSAGLWILGILGAVFFFLKTKKSPPDDKALKEAKEEEKVIRENIAKIKIKEVEDKSLKEELEYWKKQ